MGAIYGGRLLICGEILGVQANGDLIPLRHAPPSCSSESEPKKSRSSPAPPSVKQGNLRCDYCVVSKLNVTPFTTTTPRRDRREGNRLVSLCTFVQEIPQYEYFRMATPPQQTPPLHTVSTQTLCFKHLHQDLNLRDPNQKNISLARKHFSLEESWGDKRENLRIDLTIEFGLL